MRLDQITAREKGAPGHLPSVAGDGPEQRRRVADLLSAWWNPGQCGAYNITSGWGLDKDIAEDVITYVRWRRGWAASVPHVLERQHY